MRRFLALARSDHSAAQAVPRITPRHGTLSAVDFTGALDKLDILFSRLDIEATNVIQIRIQSEGLRSLLEDRMRHHARTLSDLADLHRSLELRCKEMDLRFRVATATEAGKHLSSAKLGRMIKAQNQSSRRRGRKMSRRFVKLFRLGASWSPRTESPV